MENSPLDIDLYLETRLVKGGLVTAEKLNTVREKSAGDVAFVDALVLQKLVDEDVVLDLLMEFYGLPSLNLNHYEVEPEAAEMLPSAVAQKFHVLPLFRIRNVLLIAMANPSDIHAMDEIRIKTSLGVEPVIALHSTIQTAISRVYNLTDSATDIIETITDEKIGIAATREAEKSAGNLEANIDDEPIVKLVNLFVSQAVRQGASDIHLNPEEKELRVRFRIDGVLHEIATPPKKFEPAIISRIKVLANLDIAEKRKPQDGRTKMKVENKVIDLRVSTLPTIYGENVVIRILDSANVLYGLNEIGFLAHDLAIFEKMITKPYGIILVTGPTGSGKTTTLYSALGTINSVDKNIITLEDPVEYNLKLIRQGQVNHKVGFDFAAGLRAILRQDPDVIMVGEIRDGETAQIAIEAALTGHLVFSTLHTNDSVGALTRLSEMGVEHFLLASSILCVVAQRLLRRVCQDCREQYHPAEESLLEIGLADKPDLVFFKGTGCQKCLNTGYRGRIGIYEVLVITQSMREAILRGAGSEELKQLATSNGIRFLRHDGIEKAKMGLTTIEEVLRVTREY